jgi:hypothetical protein
MKLTLEQARWNQAQVRAALRLYLKTGILPTRGATMGRLLTQAGAHTGKLYMKSRRSCDIAIADLTELLETK